MDLLNESGGKIVQPPQQNSGWAWVLAQMMRRFQPQTEVSRPA